MTEQNNPLPVKKLPEYVANEWLQIFAESFEEVKGIILFYNKYYLEI